MTNHHRIAAHLYESLHTTSPRIATPCLSTRPSGRWYPKGCRFPDDFTPQRNLPRCIAARRIALQHVTSPGPAPQHIVNSSFPPPRLSRRRCATQLASTQRHDLRRAILDTVNPDTSFAVAPAFAPTILLQDPAKGDELIAMIESEIARQKPDTSTKRGRDEIVAFAYKITRTRTALVDAGKKLVRAINDQRNDLETRLDDLRDKARKPVTDWEAADEKRIAGCNQLIDMLRAAARVPLTATSADAAETLAKVEAVVIDPDVFRELAQIATDLRAKAIEDLNEAIETIRTRERQSEELARLKRAEAAAPKPKAPAIEGSLEASDKSPAEQADDDQFAARDGSATSEPARSQPTPAPQGARIIPNRRELLMPTIEAIAKAGRIDLKAAQDIVLAIAAKQIPRVTVEL